MRIVIIGMGLIGGSLALDLKRLGLATEIVGIDQNEGHCRQALALGLVDKIAKVDASLSSADIVILAIPVNAISSLLPRVLDLVSETASVTDMGSTKKNICQAVRYHAKRLQYVASHPMAGTENSGPMAALESLFANKTAIICDQDLSGPEHFERVKKLYLAIGARLIYMSSVDHDLHVSYASHLSHLSSFALANTVLDKEKDVSRILDLAGGGFESTVRLAKSSPAMWRPILEHNREHVLAALESYIQHLTVYHRSLLESDFDKIQDLMSNANQIRRVLQTIEKTGGGDER